MKLGDCIATVRGVSYKPADLHQQRDEDCVVLLRANNIVDGAINRDDVQYVDLSKVKDRQYLRKGDILVCASSGSKKLVGKAALVIDDVREVFGAFCLVIRPDDTVEPSYLWHYFQSHQYREAIEEACTGSNINNLKPAHFNALDVAMPDMAIQKAATMRMDSVRSQMDEHLLLVNKLDMFVESRFVEMFGNGDWAERRLGELADVQGGLTKNKKREQYELQLPYLRVANVLQGELNLNEMLSIGLTEAEREKTLLRTGDLLFVEGNGSRDQIGRSAIWDGSIDPCVHQNHLIRARFGEFVLPVFALAYFTSPDGREQIVGKAVSTSGLFTLSTGKIKSLTMPVPPLALQQEFAAFVQQVDKLKADTQLAIDKLQMLYDSLAQEYFGSE